MINLKINISVFLFVMFAPLHAQDSTFFKLKGQLDAFAGMNFTNPVQTQTGARFLPLVSFGKIWKNNLKLDSEISFDSYLDYHFTGGKNDQDNSKIKPYRL